MKTILTIAAILATTSAGAQEIFYQESVKFGEQLVTLKIVNAQPVADDRGWMDPILKEKNPETKAQGLFWKGYGDQLASLAQLREQDGDLVGAYAHLYLLDELAKFNERAYAKLSAGKAQDPAWDRVQVPHYASIHKELAQLGQRLTSEQKRQAIRQAVQIYSSNPNCCMEM